MRSNSLVLYVPKVAAAALEPRTPPRARQSVRATTTVTTTIRATREGPSSGPVTPSRRVLEAAASPAVCLRHRSLQPLAELGPSSPPTQDGHVAAPGIGSTDVA